ncbi:hypothetical protein [Promicromonospora sp. NPDC019610]|uniref:hypothetical protein n=1 Tax=Promicromonospora sp. NPDC019610 TaxID=3364405 RepID=UPI003799B208
MEWSTVVGLLTAVVAVAGSVLSGWLSQRAVRTSNREAWEHQKLLRQLELNAHRDKDRDSELRQVYVEFNAAARHYLARLKDLYHEMESVDVNLLKALENVDTVKAEYRHKYAIAQMLVPDSVLPHVRATNRQLGYIYGPLAAAIRSAGATTLDHGKLRATINQTWDELATLRTEMRRDLGTSAA